MLTLPGMPALPTPDAVRRVTDPHDLRALSHPLRLRALRLLRAQGPATATALSEALDEAPSLLSYHLRTLARHGFIAEAPELANDGRERWWRALHASTRFDSTDIADDRDAQLAAQDYLRTVQTVYADVIARWQDEHDTWSEEWQRASTASDWVLRLVPEELSALNVELEAVIERYRSQEPAPGAELVQVVLHDFPRRTAP